MRIAALLVLLCGLLASANLQAQGEGLAISAVNPYVTKTGFPHFLNFTWTPDGGDPFAVTGTLDVTGATPGASGLMLASLAANDELAFGFLPVLVDVNPVNLNAYYYFGFDLAGSLTAPGISRSIPALVGMQMYIQVFGYYPLVTSSNGLNFDISP